MVVAKCLECGQEKDYFDGLAGSTVMCKYCGKWMQVVPSSESSIRNSTVLAQTSTAIADPMKRPFNSVSKVSLDTRIQVEDPLATNAQKRTLSDPQKGNEQGREPEPIPASYRFKTFAGGAISGLEGMSDDEIRNELAKGARFVVFNYCVSVILMTGKFKSNAFFIRANESSSGERLELLIAINPRWAVGYSIWTDLYCLVYRGESDGRRRHYQ